MKLLKFAIELYKQIEEEAVNTGDFKKLGCLVLVLILCLFVSLHLIFHFSFIFWMALGIFLWETGKKTNGILSFFSSMSESAKGVWEKL